jgi:leucyl-tRNA synthetase
VRALWFANRKKPMRQWVLKIREYADRLLNDIDGLDWPESIKESQRNWIGRSEGSEITFKMKDHNEEIKVFTTRADTLFGASYVVLSPEHKLVSILSEKAENSAEILSYVKAAATKSDADRSAEEKDKTGVKIIGVFAINPANNQEIPIYVADYVLAQYGTGAVMAVPAHDKRDFDFAKKYDLPIVNVVSPIDSEQSEECFIDDGVLSNSGEFDGIKSDEARNKITDYVKGKKTVNYKIRDWVFSRQRYWGEPIPMIHCEKCGIVPVSEKDLPVLLPEVSSYEPTGTGESPLAGIDSWVNTTCPKCGGAAKRETNTMPQWAGSSWYYLRYIDPKNDEALVDKDKEKYWSPVDMYIGGAEHATRHLIYARFWHKFLKDIGIVSNDEPFNKLQHVGLINGEDGRKMSKRWGNVVNPDDIVETYGADTLRMFEMFLGPFDKSVNWSTNSIIGPRRFLERVWKLSDKISETNNSELENSYHSTLKKVTHDIKTMNFNTAISEMMIFVNKIEEIGGLTKDIYSGLLKLLAPFAPHMTDELWEKLGNKGSIHVSEWPKYDENKIIAELKKIAIQVNGKVRGEIKLDQNCSEEDAKKFVLKMPEIEKWVGDKEVNKFIYLKGRIINIVVKS